MIQSSAAYQAAITGDSRRILLRAVIDIIDPDITYGDATSSGEAPFSQPGQLHDKETEISPAYATLERNRWLLDGTFQIFPDDYQGQGQQGFAGEALSGDDGSFATAPWVQLNFANVSILQACSVYFPTEAQDGVADTFTVEVLQGGTAYFTQTVTGNQESELNFSGFTVNNPDAIRVTVSKWSLPGRRIRLPEIIPGIYESWDGDIIAEFSATQQANFASTALPYGTCTLRMDNLDRRFEPRSKNGVFQSIEERQGIPVSIGVRLADGTVEWKPAGVYFQASGGWKTGDNGITMQWDLVDIVGLLADREYLPPDTLPTTLEGWAASIAAQLGVNFAASYTVDPDYADTALTCALADVQGKTCGDVLRWICQASGTFARADSETGYLAIEPYWSQGNKLTLDNLNSYPVMRANSDLAAIIFTLNDGSRTQYVVSGNSTASSETVSVQNPFIKTQAQALTAARQILATYGGNQLEAVGRGDPSSEIGDVDTVWLDESSATTGRRMYQTFTFQGGVLQGCQSVLLQADGSFLFEETAVITQSGNWTAPAGVAQLRIILVGKGGDGTDGTDGSFSAPGEDGIDGAGGKVWAGTVNINPQQAFPITIGDETVMGQYSSANGQTYPNGYTDVASGNSYARTGVQAPKAGSGDGGAGGQGGTQGARHRETAYDKDGKPIGTRWEIDVYPGAGVSGVAGVSGCAVIYWDKPYSGS